MKGTDWGWHPQRDEGIWRHGCKWARPLVAAAPWITLALLFSIFGMIDGRVTAANGVEFNLPKSGGDATISESGLVAIVMPVRQSAVPATDAQPSPLANGESRSADERGKTLVLFDDVRYILDGTSREALCRRLAESNGVDSPTTLYLLVDEGVSAGKLLELTTIARSAGIASVQIVEKRE